MASSNNEVVSSLILFQHTRVNIIQPFNAIATLHLSNVAHYVKGNRSATLRLKRTKPTSSNAALPSPPPSQSPGNRTLRLSLGDKIGEGACGLVYEATDVSLSGHSRQALPPLAVKICKNFQHYKLPSEAATYEEMESLHGLVTARYYGCFETVIRPGITFPPWQVSDPLHKSNLTEVDHPHISRVLTIIVMERLGNRRLPRRKKATDKSLRYAISPNSTLTMFNLLVHF